MVQIKGGTKLEAALREISRKVKKAATVDIGLLEGSTESDGTSSPMVGALQEFGTKSIPPRPFMRNAVTKNQDKWGPNLATNLVNNNYDADKALGLLGAEIVGEIQQEINDMQAPPLSPITVMLRGMKSNDQSLVVTGKTVGEAAQRVAEGKTNYGASAKPLIEHGDLLRNIDFVVKGK